MAMHWQLVCLVLVALHTTTTSAGERSPSSKPINKTATRPASDEKLSYQSVPWANDFQVVIGNDNQISFENKLVNPSRLSESESQNSITSYFDEHNDDEIERPAEHYLQAFESMRFGAQPERANWSNPASESSQSRVAYVSEIHHNIPESSSSSPAPPVTHKYPSSTMPSFSKMPDYLSNKLMSEEFDSEEYHFSPPHHEMEDDVVKDSGKSLVVPIGSRVHTVKYKDFSKPDSSELISKFYDKYEPNVIEVPSSKPVLPIVFNFRTKSSPIVATQTLRKTANAPNQVQYFETQEPAHYRTHVVHKPIIQDLREIIVPYRFYIQEISPVDEYKQTYVPTAVKKVPVYVPDFSAPPPKYNLMSQGNGLVPYYSGSHVQPAYHHYSSMLNKNPYVELAPNAYRVADLYNKKPSFPPFEEPNYLGYNSFNKYN